MSTTTNPLVELMQKADQLAQAFDTTHKRTFTDVQDLCMILGSPSTVQGDPSARVEQHMDALRTALQHMESNVQDMMSMLYHVDVYLAKPEVQGVSNKDPKTALEHVSELFNTYQSELLDKREALYELSCEELSSEEFSTRWQSMEEVKAGRKQTMDDLADLLAGL